MARLAGAVLKISQTLLYAIEFCCAGLILAVFSYFLAVLSDRDLVIGASTKAVEAIAGAACLYLVFAVLLTCFLGGKTFFAFLAVVLDLLFVAAFVAVAVLLRDGAGSCTGTVRTPLGGGPADSQSPGYGEAGFGVGAGENSTYFPNLGLACRLQTACFAVAIIAAVLFLVSAVLQVYIGRNHRKEKRFGPSPANNYTSGSGPFWKRKVKASTTDDQRDTELGAPVGTAVTRPSYDTGYTGSTVAHNTYTNPTGDHRKHDSYNAPSVPSTAKYFNSPRNSGAVYPTNNNPNNSSNNHVSELPVGNDSIAHEWQGAGGYHSQPVATGAYNPYGYDNTRTTGTARGF